MVKLYHEAPKSIFKRVQELTNGDYALAHLIKADREYEDIFIDAIKQGREVILDNSVFELGEAFTASSYAKMIIQLNPTWFVIPDVLDNCEATKTNVARWVFDRLPSMRREGCTSKTIGVVQGNSYSELVDCYINLRKRVDKIAFSFNYDHWLREFDFASSKEEAYMFGRIHTLNQMYTNGVLDLYKPHHLLGCALPQEFQYYRDKGWLCSWIDSIDTSNPVVHGIHGVSYDKHGLDSKISTKLCDLIDVDISNSQWSTIRNNIVQFRGMCRCFG